MPREKQFVAFCLVLDVGKYSNSSGFTKSVITVASKLIQRKLYSEENVCFQIILIGSKTTGNPLGYSNVSIASYDEDNTFTPANYSALEYLERHIQSEQSNNESDWIAGVEVAVDSLITQVEANQVVLKEKRVVIVSDLASGSKYEGKFDSILEKANKESIEIMVLCPNWKELSEFTGQDDQDNQANGDHHGKPMSAQQRTNAELVCALVSSTNGMISTIENALTSLMNMERKTKRPFPWKVDLQIGPDIKFNVTGYIKVRRENLKPWKRCRAGDPDSEEIKPSTSYVRNNDQQEEVDKDDLIESYKYGSQLIAISDADKEQAYDGGDKCMLVIGFMAFDQIPKHYFMGDGSMVFYPTDGDPESLYAMSAMLEAMKRQDMVALVRRVYRKGTAPKLGVLIPEEKEDNGETKKFFAYVEVPFMEDVRDFVFAPLHSDKNGPSEEQLKSVDGLIDALLVENGSEDDIQTDSIVNPFYQHLFSCLTHRALQPGRVLPEPDEHNNAIMAQPAKLEEASKEPLSQIAKVFKLENVQKERKKVTGDSAFGKRDAEENGDETEPKRPRTQDFQLTDAMPAIDNISTVTPVDDFQSLLRSGIQFTAIVPMMEKVIIKFLTESLGDQFDTKILACIQAYRSASLELKSSVHFNHFIMEFKSTLMQQKKNELWSKLMEANATLISVFEDTKSGYSESDVKAFASFEPATVVQEVQENDEDLLDEL